MRLGLLQCMLSPMGGVFTEYSADIHKVVIGYSYVSGMYRVCVGYVSRMYRNRLQRYNIFFIYANIIQEVAQKNRHLCRT